MNPFAALGRYFRRSLVRQMVVALVMVQGVLVSVFIVDLVSREAAFRDKARAERAQGVAEMLAANGASWMLSEDLQGLDELVRSAASFPGLRYATFVSPSGRVLAHSDPGVVGEYVADERGRSLTRGPSEVRWLASTSVAVDVAAPVVSRSDGRRLGWAWVSLSREDVAAAARSALLEAVLYAALATIAAAVVAVLIARNIVRGLAQLARVSSRFRAGDRAVRVVEGRLDEVGAVGLGLNAMLETLAESEQSLRATQHLAKLGSWRCDVGSGTLQWSDEAYAIFGYSRGRAPPTLAEFLAGLPEEGRAMFVALLNAEAPQRRFTLKMPLELLNGSQGVCWIDGRFVFDAKGRLAALIGLCQDVTEQESAAAQLRQAQKMEAVGQLTGGLAHDFNNLLSVIIGNIDFLDAELPPESPAREYSETALAAALKGSELTRQLLAFSRRQPLAPKVIDLNELVSGMSALVRRTIGQDIVVQIRRGDGALPTKADPSQVESALLNLVINARDAMPSGGTLTLETGVFEVDEEYANSQLDALPGKYSVVSVSDSGEGIAPEVLAKVFEPFFTTKAVGKGSGLGLSMIYGFAKQSGGHVRIYSEVGHGTTVRLFLPADAGQPSAVPADARAIEAPRPGEETVLVVEDDEEVRRVAVRQLKELGYLVLEAENGEGALRVLATNADVDLLFTDVVMPGGMSGIDLVKRARGDNPHLKVLYTTGFTEAAANTSGGFTGSDLLISKPYRKTDLAARVREVLEAA